MVARRGDDVATTGTLTGDMAMTNFGTALTRHSPRRGRTWTQTEADQPQLQLNGS